MEKTLKKTRYVKKIFRVTKVTKVTTFFPFIAKFFDELAPNEMFHNRHFTSKMMWIFDHNFFYFEGVIAGHAKTMPG